MAARMVAAGPRVVVVVGPHGPVARHAFVALGAPVISGSLAEFGAPEVRLDMRTDVELLAGLREAASEAGLAVLEATSSEIDYATLVPLYYLKKQGYDGRALVISTAFADLQTCYRFGRALARAAGRHPRSVAVLASGDLSHRLKRGAPAGYDPRGAEFDRLVMASLAAGDPEPLLNVDPGLREGAGECGLCPIVVMLGAIDGQGLCPAVLSYEGPFGVGYGVALFEEAGAAEGAARATAGEGTARATAGEGTARATAGEGAARATAGDSARATAGDPSRAPAADAARATAGDSARATAGAAGNHASSSVAAMPASGPHPLVQLARRAIEVYIRQAEVIDPPPEPVAPGLPATAGAFVSLYRGGDLRGCIGTIEPTRDSLNDEVVHNAIAAASEDPRFDPLTPGELAGLALSVDVLGEAEPVTDPGRELDPRHYGVIIAKGRRRGLLLPDLEGVDSVDMQLSIAARKAGLSPSDPGVRLYRFSVKRYR
jgi:AmmeMemoRadiSam system protein A/AmmeMemoRadiSam system protein B